VGVVEVEGTRGVSTAQKNAEYSELETLRFALLLLYAYFPKGRGPDRRMPPARDPDTIEEVRRVSASYPDRPMIVVTVDKVYERQREGIRKCNEYYWSRPSQVSGFSFEDGEESTSLTLYGDRMSDAPDSSDQAMPRMWRPGGSRPPPI
jgi:hypothetical protein